jgi:ABC-type cobalamin/Fe3+-siderophores transport system ATPase subunit
MIKLKEFFSLLLCMVIVSACNSDKFSETEILSQDENVEFVFNSYALNADAAVAKATSFLKNNEVVLRSGKESKDLTSSVQLKNYDVKIVELSKEQAREVKQTVPVYTVNYKDDLNKEAGFVVLA